MAAVAMLKSIKRPNSAISERIRTKFHTHPENKVPEQFLPSELVSHKIQDGGRRHIENHLFGHNSAAFAHICTEFDTDAENGVPQPGLPSKFTQCKNSRWRRSPF